MRISDWSSDVCSSDLKRYRIGSRIFTLAAGALEENALLSLATPVLERLNADTGEAAHLAVRSKQEIVVIARTAASGLLQLAGRTGATRPAHATAIGKMLLAAMAPDDLDRSEEHTSELQSLMRISYAVF